MIAIAAAQATSEACRSEIGSVNSLVRGWHALAIKVAIAAVAGILLLYLVDRDAAYPVMRVALGIGITYILVTGVVANRMRERVLTRIYREIERVVAAFGREITPLVQLRKPFPTLLALLKTGELLLVDWESHYDFQPIPSSRVSGALVERRRTAHSRTRHSGGTGVGMMLGSGLMVASTGGGRSTTTTEISEDAVVEVRVQRERNGPMSCHTFAFGRDGSTAETLAATINRLIDARVE